MSNVLLVGCGHMGSALIDSWIELKSYYFTIVDPFNYNYLKKKYNKINNIQILDNKPSQDQIKKIDIIIFAIKPQVSEKVINEYRDFYFKKNSVIGSIIAGKKINFFKSKIKNSIQLVRIMPNMPSLIGSGVSCFLANKHLSKYNRKKINDLFLKVGKTIWLKNEDEIDMATAVSGSGPGYIFTLIDAMEKASQQIGLSKKISRELVLSTILGSAKLIKQIKKNPKDLANSIAIKGGTTEAGIKVLNKNKINKIIYNTVLAAYKKASSLGKTND